MTAERLPRTPTFLIVGVWLALLVPELARSLAEPKVWRPVTDGETELSGFLAPLTTACNAALVLGCAVVVVLGVRRLPWGRALPLALVLAAWLATVVPLVVDGRSPRLTALIVPAVVTAMWAARPQRGHVEVLGYLTGALAALSLVLGLALPRSAIFERSALVDGEKAVSPLGILAGVLQTGNLLGLALAVGLASVLVVRRDWHRWTLLGLVLVALVWSASRTSLVAAAAVGVAWLGMTLASSGRGGALVSPPRRLATWWLVLVAIGALALPFLTTSATAFTNRGGYWIASLEAWGSSPWIGHGADYFKLLALGEDNLGGHAYHAHNQVVQVLVTGGVLLGVLAVAILVVLGVRAVRWAALGDAWPVLVLTAFAVVASFEVPVGLVDRLVYVPFVLVPLTLVAFAEPSGALASRGHRDERAGGFPAGSSEVDSSTSVASDPA